MADIDELIAKSGATPSDFFKPIADLPKTYWEGLAQRQKQKVDNLFTPENGGVPMKDGKPDYDAAAIKLLGAGGGPQVGNAKSLGELGIQRDNLQFGRDYLTRINGGGPGGNDQGTNDQTLVPPSSATAVPGNVRREPPPPGSSRGGVYSGADASGAGQGQTSIVGVLTAQGISEDQIGVVAASVSRQLGGIDPNQPIDVKDPQVRAAFAQVLRQPQQPTGQQTAPQQPPPQQPPQQQSPQTAQPLQAPQQQTPPVQPQQAAPGGFTPMQSSVIENYAPPQWKRNPQGYMQMLQVGANTPGPQQAGAQKTLDAINASLKPDRMIQPYYEGRQPNESLVDFESRLNREKALSGKTGEAMGGQIAEYINRGPTSQKRVQQLDIMRDALERGNGNITTGPFANLALKAKEAIGSLFDIDVSGTGEAEVAQKIGFGLASAAVKEISSRPSQFEFMKGLENNPGLLLSTKGSLMMIDILRQSSRQDLVLSKLAQRPENHKNWAEVVDKFYNDPKNALVSPFDRSRKLGLKDMEILQAQPGATDPQSGAKPGAAQRAAIPPPGVQGARQAKDGNWYVSDPARPGKYLMVR